MLEQVCIALGWKGGTIHQVLDEIAELRRDAERYRGLRNAPETKGSTVFIASYRGGPVAMLGGEIADKTVDAAFASQALHS